MVATIAERPMAYCLALRGWFDVVLDDCSDHWSDRVGTSLLAGVEDRAFGHDLHKPQSRTQTALFRGGSLPIRLAQPKRSSVLFVTPPTDRPAREAGVLLLAVL